MTYARTCTKCNGTFYTGNSSDNTCIYCDGVMPKLKYYEVDKHE